MKTFTVTTVRGLTFGLLLIFTVLGAGCDREIQATSPKEMIGEGWKKYQMGEFKFAIKAFEKSLEEPKITQDEKVQAMYGLAITWDLRRPDEDQPKAIAYYNQIIQLEPDSVWAAWSSLAIVRMKHLAVRLPDMTLPKDSKENKAYQETLEKIYQDYQKVIDRYGQTKAGEEAVIYQQAIRTSRLTTEECKKTRDTLLTFIQKHPNSPYASAAWGLLSTCYTILNQPELKLQALINQNKTQVIDPSNPFFDNSWLYWIIATVAEFEAGDFPTARVYYTKLITEYPRDSRIYLCQKALKRMNAVEAGLRKGQT
jgi:tetratricopeptide (TPR) repeat protein